MSPEPRAKTHPPLPTGYKWLADEMTNLKIAKEKVEEEVTQYKTEMGRMKVEMEEVKAEMKEVKAEMKEMVKHMEGMREEVKKMRDNTMVDVKGRISSTDTLLFLTRDDVSELKRKWVDREETEEEVQELKQKIQKLKQKKW